MSSYFMGTGYDSAGRKANNSMGERCRNCSFVFSEHCNGRCPCEECNEVHRDGQCPEEKKRA